MNKGGAERVISILLNEFVNDKKMNLHFIQMEDGLEYELPKGIKRTILSKAKKGKIRKFIELPFVALQVSNYIKKNKIDVTMSFLFRSNYVNILTKIFGTNSKSIINIRSTSSRYINEGISGKVNLFLIRNLFNKANTIISNSKGVEEDLKSLMPISVKTMVINNPFDIEYINLSLNNASNVSFSFKENVRYIISVGRIIPLKRNQDLLHAFYSLSKQDKNLELIFLGDGISRSHLNELSIKLNLRSKVHFIGKVSNPFYYLSRSDLFVLSSETEGFPNVLVEAMASGVPVISSDCKSGPREILKDEKYGLLYEVGDVNHLVSKIKYYLYESIDIQEIKNKGKKRANNFHKDIIIRKFRGVLS